MGFEVIDNKDYNLVMGMVMGNEEFLNETYCSKFQNFPKYHQIIYSLELEI